MDAVPESTLESWKKPCLGVYFIGGYVRVSVQFGYVPSTLLENETNPASHIHFVVTNGCMFVTSCLDKWTGDPKRWDSN